MTHVPQELLPWPEPVYTCHLQMLPDAWCGGWVVRAVDVALFEMAFVFIALLFLPTVWYQVSYWAERWFGITFKWEWD